MQPAWKVLAPIDLSVDPEGPVEHAIDIAMALDANLTLLHVGDQRWWPSNAFTKTGADCDIHRLILPGHPAKTIARYAEFINADLLAMTSENCGRWSRFWKQSVTRDVMGYTRRQICMTDIRSTDADYRFSCRRILCALSLDGTDDPLVTRAEALAQRSGGNLILLGVVPGIDEGLLLESITGFDRPLSPSLAVERIGTLGKGISVPYRTSVMMGSPYKCIRIAAREHNVDVVMAARSTPGQTQSNCLDMRSVLRGLPCPLVSITGSSASVRPYTRERMALPDLEHASSV